MKDIDHSRHIHHHKRLYTRLHYSTTIEQRWYYIFLMPVLVLILSMVLLDVVYKTTLHIPSEIFYQLCLAVGVTLFRLIVAYCLAVIIALPLSFLIFFNRTVERLLLPVYDILESVPALAFFPIIILFFVNVGFLNGAAIFIIFLAMLWNIVFSVVGGLTAIPEDLRSASAVFGLKGFAFIKDFLFPAIVPQLILGSILAFAQGWNIIIVAEVLHTYIPAGVASDDLFGIGSMLVHASTDGQNSIFFGAVLLMVFTIAVLNFFVWQKLLIYAEHFKFD